MRTMKPSDLFNRYPPDFEQFWKLYPKKKSKGQAERAWAKLTPDDRQAAINDLNHESRPQRDKQWLTENGKFIPYPATYLNGKCFEDEWEAGEPEPKKEQFWKLSDRELVKRCQELQIRTEGKSRDELIGKLGDKQ